MKKLNIFLTLLIFGATVFLNAKNSFFLENRYGALIKVDPGSAYKTLYPEQKGPTLGELEVRFEEKEFETFITKVSQNEKDFLVSVYKKEGNSYKLNPSLEEVIKIAKIIDSSKIVVFSYEKINRQIFEKNILPSLKDDEKELIKSKYKLVVNNYILQVGNDTIKNAKKIREIFLKYNSKNEIYNALEVDGTPMPHSFPRVHNAKSKANFDIHLAWGVRIEDRSFPGSITLGFSVNVTNFTMFSLELITFKYGFDMKDNPFEPYLGFAIYGGYIDGFPIGINFLGGLTTYPIAITYNDEVNKKFFVNGEVRVGPVIYVPVYFDTGLNTETIYKKISVLMEGGLFVGTGYIFK